MPDTNDIINRLKAIPHICEITQQDDRLKLKIVCPFCFKVSVLELTTKEASDWLDGEYVQNALSGHNKDDRELLISGICPKCWDTEFDENVED